MCDNNVTTTGQAAPVNKKSGIPAGVICIMVGILLFILGLVLYNIFGSSSRKKLKDYSESYSAADVKKLDLDIEWASFTIEKSEDDNIYIDAKDVPKTFEASVSGNTFKISFGKQSVNLVPFSTFLDKNRVDPTIVLQLPEKVYSSFVLDLGAGETNISGINCGDLDIECGAGKVSFNDISCDKCVIDCGAGELDINNIICEGLLDIDGGAGKIYVSGILGGIDIDQGVGDFEFSGTMNGNIDADGGVGKITFRLTNPPDDFYNDGGKYKLNIDTGIGSANVYYSQEQ